MPLRGMPDGLPMEPPEPRIVGTCAYCGCEIYPGDMVFRGDEGTIHADCIMELMRERLGLYHIAERCGYTRGIAE